MHSRPADHIFVQVSGRIDHTIGEDTLAVSEYDLLVAPGNVARSAFNPGFEDALFFSVHDQPPEGETYSASYRGNGPDRATEEPVGRGPTHLKWKQYSRRAASADGFSQRYGYHRSAYPLIETETMWGRAIGVPAGQGSPWQTISGEVIFVGLLGEIEVYADGEVYPLGPRDVLRISTSTYALQNVGFSEGLYVSLGSKSGRHSGPVYYEPAVANDPVAGPGEPISAV